MKKIIFPLMISIVTLCFIAYAEMPDKKSATDKKDDVQQLIIKGNQAFSAQRYDDAITFYKQAIVLDPGSIDANYNLGVSYGEKAMIEESIAAYERVVSLNPNHAQAHNNLGFCYDAKGMAEKAHSEYEKAVSADPNLPPALYNLGKSYLTRGDHDKAADYLCKAGLLFHKSKNEKWAKLSYDLLKQTNSKECEKELHKLLYPETGLPEKEKIVK